jgi:hypothetical protein
MVFENIANAVITDKYIEQKYEKNQKNEDGHGKLWNLIFLVDFSSRH